MLIKTNSPKLFPLLILILIFPIIFYTGCTVIKQAGKNIPNFDGERAFKDVQYQVSLGPRIPGTAGQDKILKWLDEELSQNKWEVELQVHEIGDKTITNGGIHGTVVELSEHTVTLKIADKVNVKFQRSAVISLPNKKSKGK